MYNTTVPIQVYRYVMYFDNPPSRAQTAARNKTTISSICIMYIPKIRLRARYCAVQVFGKATAVRGERVPCIKTSAVSCVPDTVRTRVQEETRPTSPSPLNIYRVYETLGDILFPLWMSVSCVCVHARRSSRAMSSVVIAIIPV